MRNLIWLLPIPIILAGCAAGSSMTQEEQLRIMSEVAASRHTAEVSFSKYADICLEAFPGAIDFQDDGANRLSIQGSVNVSMNDSGRDIVCSINIAEQRVERVLMGQSTYTLNAYRFRVKEDAASALRALESRKVESEMIVSGNYEKFLKAAKNAASSNFKDPDSARFRSLFLSNKGLPTLCGEVNAKNSYGGYVGYKKFFYNRLGAYVDDSKEPGVSSMYRNLEASYCDSKFADIESPASP